LSRFGDHTQTHTTLGGTPLGEGSSRRRDLSVPDNKRHSQTTDIHVSGWIRTLDPNKRAVTDRAVSVIGSIHNSCFFLMCKLLKTAISLYRINGLCSECSECRSSLPSLTGNWASPFLQATKALRESRGIALLCF
jgi:hypothetical protein